MACIMIQQSLKKFILHYLVLTGDYIWQEETLNCSSLFCRKQALEVIMTKMLFLVPSGESTKL
jgi:hypothetical protein